MECHHGSAAWRNPASDSPPSQRCQETPAAIMSPSRAGHQTYRREPPSPQPVAHLEAMGCRDVLYAMSRPVSPRAARPGARSGTGARGRRTRHVRAERASTQIAAQHLGSGRCVLEDVRLAHDVGQVRSGHVRCERREHERAPGAHGSRHRRSRRFREALESERIDVGVRERARPVDTGRRSTDTRCARWRR